jgi:diguanylate cyclase (GGDEF)-like protein
MSTEVLPLLRAVCDVLDSLGIGACIFDEQDRTLLWNRSFLRYFPEHGGQIYSGEPYEANLRRFFAVRLSGMEQAQVDRYVREAIGRHRSQSRPFAFVHRGRRLRVGSLPLPGIGRLRLWTEQATPMLAGPVDAGGADLSLFDHLPDAVMVTTPDGLIAWVNETFVFAYGLPDREAAIGRSFEDLYRGVWTDEPDRAGYDAGRMALTERMRYTGAPFELPLPMDRWVRIVGHPGAEGRGVFAHVDITELKRKERSLMLAEQRARDSEARLREKSSLLEATLERMEQGLMMVNAEHVVEVCNPRAVELLGLPAELMASRPRFEDVLAFQWASDEFSRTSQDLQDFVRAGGILDKPHAYDRERPDGRIIEVRSVPLSGGGVLRTYTDVSERRRREEHIRHRAQHDGLTALMNRDSFREHLVAVLADRRAAGFALHFIDLDHFKPVNDRHGHAVGDRALIAVADRLRAVARDGDVVARLGGDEFGILQQGVQQAEHALGLARRVVAMLAQPFTVDGLSLQVGASVGVAVVAREAADAADADALMRAADAAMYAAKSAGRGTVRLHGAAADDQA